MKALDTLNLYRDTQGSWRWRYIHVNSNVLATGAEGYTRRIDCLRSAAHVCGRPFRKYRIIIGERE